MSVQIIVSYIKRACGECACKELRDKDVFSCSKYWEEYFPLSILDAAAAVDAFANRLRTDKARNFLSDTEFRKHCHLFLYLYDINGNAKPVPFSNPPKSATLGSVFARHLLDGLLTDFGTGLAVDEEFDPRDAFQVHRQAYSIYRPDDKGEWTSVPLASSAPITTVDQISGDAATADVSGPPVEASLESAPAATKDDFVKSMGSSVSEYSKAVASSAITQFGEPYQAYLNRLAGEENMCTAIKAIATLSHANLLYLTEFIHSYGASKFVIGAAPKPDVTVSLLMARDKVRLHRREYVNAFLKSYLAEAKAPESNAEGCIWHLFHRRNNAIGFYHYNGTERQIWTAYSKAHCSLNIITEVRLRYRMAVMAEKKVNNAITPPKFADLDRMNSLIEKLHPIWRYVRVRRHTKYIDKLVLDLINIPSSDGGVIVDDAKLSLVQEKNVPPHMMLLYFLEEQQEDRLKELTDQLQALSPQRVSTGAIRTTQLVQWSRSRGKSINYGWSSETWNVDQFWNLAQKCCLIPNYASIIEPQSYATGSWSVLAWSLVARNLSAPNLLLGTPGLLRPGVDYTNTHLCYYNDEFGHMSARLRLFTSKQGIPSRIPYGDKSIRSKKTLSGRNYTISGVPNLVAIEHDYSTARDVHSWLAPYVTVRMGDGKDGLFTDVEGLPAHVGPFTDWIWKVLRRSCVAWVWPDTVLHDGYFDGSYKFTVVPPPPGCLHGVFLYAEKQPQGYSATVSDTVFAPKNNVDVQSEVNFYVSLVNRNYSLGVKRSPGHLYDWMVATNKDYDAVLRDSFPETAPWGPPFVQAVKDNPYDMDHSNYHLGKSRQMFDEIDALLDKKLEGEVDI